MLKGAVAIILAQNPSVSPALFHVKDISHPNDVFSSANNEAAVIIRCHEFIPLSFTSSMDKSVEPFRRELQGADSVYYISFKRECMIEMD